MRVPTVKIKTNTSLGYKIINESDFDKDKDQLFVRPATTPSFKIEIEDADDEKQPRRGRPPKTEKEETTI